MEKRLPSQKFFRKKTPSWGLLMIALGTPVLGNPSAPSSFVIGQDGFDSKSLVAPQFRESAGFSLLNPQRFSMAQSYSMAFTGSGQGSASSGVYLNTLSYQLAEPLILSMDLGFYTPLHSTFGSSSGFGQPGIFQEGGMSANLVLPRIGLEYQASDHLHFSLQWVNGEDAWKAYGPSTLFPR